MNSSQYQPVAWPSPSLSSKADFVAALPLPRLLRDLMPAWLEEEHRSSGAQVTLGAVEDDNTQRSRCSKKLLRMPWCLLSTAIKLSCCLPRLLKALHWTLYHRVKGTQAFFFLLHSTTKGATNLAFFIQGTNQIHLLPRERFLNARSGWKLNRVKEFGSFSSSLKDAKSY